MSFRTAVSIWDISVNVRKGAPQEVEGQYIERHVMYEDEDGLAQPSKRKLSLHLIQVRFNLGQALYRTLSGS